MEFFAKIGIAYLVSVSVLTPILYFTFRWIFMGDHISASVGAITFILGVWIFYETLKRIEIENKDVG